MDVAAAKVNDWCLQELDRDREDVLVAGAC